MQLIISSQCRSASFTGLILQKHAGTFTIKIWPDTLPGNWQCRHWYSKSSLTCESYRKLLLHRNLSSGSAGPSDFLQTHCAEKKTKLLDQHIVHWDWIGVYPYSLKLITFFLWRCGPTRTMASSFLMFLDQTQRRITVSRTPLDEWSARRRDLYLTKHNSHNRHTSMSQVGLEPTISTSEWPQTYALDRAATGTGLK